MLFYVFFSVVCIVFLVVSLDIKNPLVIITAPF